MRDLTRNEVVAMWLWHNEYAAQGGGAIEWYARLTKSEKRIVADFVSQYEVARQSDLKTKSRLAGTQGERP